MSMSASRTMTSGSICSARRRTSCRISLRSRHPRPFGRASRQASSRIGYQSSSYSEYERTIELLVSAGLIEDATKIWWDLRPSTRFPTLEMRITDVCPLVEDGIAIASLFRCILRLLYRLRRENQRWRYYPPFLVRENRWRAQRYGIEQGMVDFGKGAVVPFPVLLEELFELIAEDAAHFGCIAEVAHARMIVQRGTSADRQLARYDAIKKLGGSEQAALVGVVDEIVEETLMLPSTATAQSVVAAKAS